MIFYGNYAFFFQLKVFWIPQSATCPKQLLGVCRAAWKFQAFKEVIKSLLTTMIKEKRFTRNDFGERADFQSE